jgi:hypothetical protein
LHELHIGSTKVYATGNEIAFKIPHPFWYVHATQLNGAIPYFLVGYRQYKIARLTRSHRKHMILLRLHNQDNMCVACGGVVVTGSYTEYCSTTWYWSTLQEYKYQVQVPAVYILHDSRLLAVGRMMNQPCTSCSRMS